jgi:RNA polymerase sigma-70 factor (ECF subfamily)
LTENERNINPVLAANLAGNDLLSLVKACRANDRSAQRKFYDHYAPLIFGIIRRYTSNRDAAEEIHSAAFYRIFKSLDQYRFEGSFEGWMRRIAVNVLSDHFRKSHPNNLTLGEDAEDIPAFTDESGHSKMAYKDLLLLIQQLPDTQRAVFNLFVFEECNHKEIADLLGIRENNSRWHLNDARRRLKEQIIVNNR